MIDSHAHLNDEKLYENYKEIIKSARDNGVSRIVIPGWDLTSSRLAVKIANDAMKKARCEE